MLLWLLVRARDDGGEVEAELVLWTSGDYLELAALFRECGEVFRTSHAPTIAAALRCR
jgi:hypothetical protein